MKVYVINLDRSVERWASISKQLNSAGVMYQRIPAVDGQRTPTAELVDDEMCFRQMGRGLRQGEVGCYLSETGVLIPRCHLLPDL